ncbi:hypothetical protein [Streptomyces sp. NBC_00334]|uniref:hypothetical protein n=1 Tax=Streptomyces sp. NBC_00334 TaxID=2975713 RepID=UPI002E2A7332|nr:hypothetical protein [Streptomyces sp. NBC_00334]
MKAPEPEKAQAAGTTRRLQALAVAGWPTSRLARETGLAPSYLSRVLKGDLAEVPVSMARMVAAVYVQLGAVSPGLSGVSHIAARAARERAAAALWAPPAAWDDDTIDDPAAIPQWTGSCGTTRGALAHDRDGIPLCPPCEGALRRRRLRDQAHAARTTATHA